MDVTHPGISSNKKQAVEAATTRPDFLQWSVYPLDNASHYHSSPGQVQGGLVSGPSQFVYMVDVPLGTGVKSMGRKDFHDPCQGDASLNSHNHGEMLKAKINHVSDSENVMFAPISNFLRKVDDGRLLRSTSCNKYYGTFLSLGSPCQIKDGNNTPLDVIRNEGLDLSLTLGKNYEEKRDIIVSGRTDEGPTEHASSMAIADNKAILDYPNYAYLSRATSQMNTIERMLIRITYRCM
ncbi:hypothetical protein NL676_003919 [Syzygium grande]|nr:hypothetical protein NL676_003919 [Syzygium grande]